MTADFWTTVLTSSVVSAVISAATNLATQFLATRRSATYSAIRVATTLEAFVVRCVNELSDHDAHWSSKGAIGSETMKLPDFLPYPTDVAWQNLPPKLTERALTLITLVELESRSMVRFMEQVEGPTETDHAIEATASRGLEALELADELRRLFSLPAFYGAAESTRILKQQLEAVGARVKRNRESLTSPLNPS